MRNLLAAAAVAATLAPALAWGQNLEDLKRQYDTATSMAQKVKTLGELAQVKSPMCVEYLRGLYKAESGDHQVRLQVVKTIGKVGVSPAPEVLQDIMWNGMLSDPSHACRALSLVKPQVDPAPFFKALEKGNAADLRRHAARAMERYPKVEVAQALARVLDESDLPPEVRRAAKTTLLKLIARDPCDKWLIEQALGPESSLGTALPDLILLTPSTNAPGRIEILYRHLASSDTETRYRAADALGEIAEGTQAADTNAKLAPLLKDANEEVVLSAALAIGRIGPTGEAVDGLIALCDHSSERLRTVATAALRMAKEEHAVAAVAQGLKDKKGGGSVQRAAVHALRELGTHHKDVVPRLVEALQRERKSGRLREDLLQALRYLTGADEGDKAKKWKKWWKDQEAGFDPKSVKRRGPITGGGADKPGSDHTLTRGGPTYYGAEVVSLRIAFVCDISSSMHGKSKRGSAKFSRFDVLKQQLVGVLKKIPKGSKFNIHVFHQSFESWSPKLQKASPAKRTAAVQWVNKLQTGGGTNIFDPLESALLDSEVDTIYLLSDGGAGFGKYILQEDILREIHKINASRYVRIHTILIGTENELLNKMAQQNRGRFLQP